MPAKPWSHLIAPGKLRRWRKKSKLTQQVVADSIGSDLASYNAFERERERPGLDLAARIEIETDGAVRCVDWAEDVEAKQRRRARAA